MAVSHGWEETGCWCVLGGGEVDLSGVGVEQTVLVDPITSAEPVMEDIPYLNTPTFNPHLMQDYQPC